MDVFAIKSFDEISKEAKDIINLFNFPLDQYITKSKPELYGSFAQKIQPYFSDIDTIVNIEIDYPHTPDVNFVYVNNKAIIKFNDRTEKSIFVKAFTAKIYELSKMKDVFIADIKCGRYKDGKPIHWKVDEILKTKLVNPVVTPTFERVDPRSHNIRTRALDVKQTTENQETKEKILKKSDQYTFLDGITDDSVIKIDLIVPYEKRYIEATAIYHIVVKYNEKHFNPERLDNLYEDLLVTEFPETAKKLLVDYNIPDNYFKFLRPGEPDEYYTEIGFKPEEIQILNKYYDYAFYQPKAVKYEKVIYNIRRNNLNFGYIGMQPIRDKDFYLSRGFSNYEADQLIRMSAEALLSNLRANAIKYLHDRELYKMFKRIFSQLKVINDKVTAEKIAPLFSSSIAIIGLQRVNLKVIQSLYQFRIIPDKDFVFNEVDTIAKILKNDKITSLLQKYKEIYKNEKICIDTLEIVIESLNVIINAGVMKYMKDRLGWNSIHDLEIHTDFINKKTAKDFEKDREEAKRSRSV